VPVARAQPVPRLRHATAVRRHGRLAANDDSRTDVKWFVDDATVLGSEGYFMARVDGAVASGFRPGFHGHGLFFDADIASRRSMWFAAVDVMADLHRLDVSALDLPETLGTDMLATIEDQLDSVSAETPVLRQALEYLRAAAPHDVDTVLCWGDARPGNIIYRGGEVAAVLDWELAHYGSPEDDLAYFLLVDEVVAELHNVPRLAGLPDPGETIAHYEARLGRTVNNLEYHRVLQALRMAAMLVLTVKLSPPELVFPPNYLDENIPTRRLAELLRSAG
jgi:aminoglycoside phosphotransferase (APT) family kinase protein